MLRNIDFPGNLEDFYATLLPIATFDILPSEYSTDLVFEFEDELSEDSYPEYLLLDYEYHSSIPNLGSIFWFGVYIILLIVVGIPLTGFFRKARLLNVGKVRQHKFKLFVIATLLPFLLESCLEFFIAVYLNLRDPDFSSTGGIVSFVFILSFALASSAGLVWLISKKVVFIEPEQIDDLNS
mmetsp:Transcript_24423/g.37864  ORF Transcript_24423/g.37864 Transcript_24423/m.37864 type:complete len:182 (-) Transcript_24423:1369-1914(-)